MGLEEHIPSGFILTTSRGRPRVRREEFVVARDLRAGLLLPLR